jgi:hypothetical protein
MDIDGSKHFYEFYEKLNVISEIINKTTTTIPSDPTPLFNKIFGDSRSERDMKINETDERPTLRAILNKQHESGDLIKTFMYDKPTGKTGKTETNFIAKNLRIGSTTDIILIAINKKAEVQGPKTPAWFDSDMFSIFNLDEFEYDDTKKNIKELHSVTHKDYTLFIRTLFKYHYINHSDTRLDNYVWESKYNMLGLLTQPFLLLTFDMYFYNVNGAPLFRKNFDVIEEASEGEAATNKISVESLLAINIFKQNQLPTFLMLLIYYAGYSFNIELHDITSKFRNKFNQSSNKTSFPIKLYVPISHPMETKYNNLLKSAIKPDSVDLNVETLQVYHVGYQIASLWDYVNGKLTILINNMLNSNSKDDKARLTDLFKKKYTSNNLFLFECINELKKYKEYILNPANITTIEFPMSTLKTLEILILKLSYILSVLEPTFIPIETMSFDVVMNGKTLKYVINSELQATNISIDDNISNDKLMAAILSTRAGVMGSTTTGKETANLLLSETESREIIKSSIQKEADISRSNKIEKTIAYTKIHDEFVKSNASLAQLTDHYTKAGFSDEDLKLTETYMNSVVQNSELKLADKKAELEQNYANDIYSAASALLSAFNTSSFPTQPQFAAFRTPKPDINNASEVTGIIAELRAKKEQLATAAGQSPEQLATMARSRRRIEEIQKSTKTRSKVKRTLGESGESGESDESGDTLVASEDTESVKVTIMPYHTKDERRCGLTFGQYNTVIKSDYKLGKIVNTDKNNIPVELFKRKKQYTLEQWWPFTKNIAGNTISIDSGDILSKIEAIDSTTGTLTPYWDKYDNRSALSIIGDKKATFDKDGDKKTAIAAIGKQHEEMIYKHQNLFDKLDNLLTNSAYIFTFQKPKLQKSSTVDRGLTGGGKNTTKKVNRKQVQSKTKNKKQKR